MSLHASTQSEVTVVCRAFRAFEDFIGKPCNLTGFLVAPKATRGTLTGTISGPIGRLPAEKHPSGGLPLYVH
jgi:hypothetical protein